MDIREIMSYCRYCGLTYMYRGSTDPGNCGRKSCIAKYNLDNNRAITTDAGEPSKITPIVFGTNNSNTVKKTVKKNHSNVIKASNVLPNNNPIQLIELDSRSNLSAKKKINKNEKGNKKRSTKKRK